MGEIKLKNFLGEYISQRTYMYMSPDKLNPTNIQELSQHIKSEHINGETYKLSWGNNYEKSIEISIEDNFIKRSGGYYIDSPTTSKILELTENLLVAETSYGGDNYLETLIVIEPNKIRIRNQIGRNCSGNIILVGNYYETALA